MTDVIEVREGMSVLGPSVVAIGVFDGVHLGHQALLRDTAMHAEKIGALAVALTFDRDPDQVVAPATAAPQLLTLEDKCHFIGTCGIDTVLVAPFTPRLAAFEPAEFLQRMLATCCDLRGVHVGEDFRFGARASGDIRTLLEWGSEHGIHIEGHRLVVEGGAPITSTRIRGLVAEGRVEDAADLLGRPTRVTGEVHAGRGEGRGLGFPTANVVPVPYAALPGAGVYAGRALLPDGSAWPAAISTGRPPMFPDALDTLEAHLIGFEGDLYGSTVTLEFIAWLREQLEFESVGQLSAAIADDVRDAGRIVIRFEADTHEHEEFVDDPEALEAAEKAVAGLASRDSYDPDIEWVALSRPKRLSGIFGDAGFSAALVTAPLDAAGIPHSWDPYAPEDMPGMRPYYGIFDRKFTLLVPADRVEEAREAMRSAGLEV